MLKLEDIADPALKAVIEADYTQAKTFGECFGIARAVSLAADLNSPSAAYYLQNPNGFSGMMMRSFINGLTGAIHGTTPKTP